MGDDGRRVDAVTFDFWNTLVSEVGGESMAARRDAWFQRFAAAGLEVEAERIESSFAMAWNDYSVAWERNEQYTPARAARRALAHLDLPLEPATVDELVDLFVMATDGLRPDLCPGVAHALTDLSDRGLLIGIICDVGFTPSPILRDWLDAHGVLKFFTGWSFSDEVGWFKPAPEIFAHALAYLAVAPHRVAHVGDLRRTDVAGARSAGLISVRYRGAYDDASELAEADIVLDHHEDLVASLGL
jgi:putative hydrolase of the HAD superfamily